MSLTKIHLLTFQINTEKARSKPVKSNTHAQHLPFPVSS